MSASIRTVYAYSPYGEVQTLGSDEGNPLQYTGRENDGTGLYNYRARYYDPVLKRFVSEDPIGISGGLNTYAYVGGKPVNLTDPSGEQSPGQVETIQSLLKCVQDCRDRAPNVCPVPTVANTPITPPSPNCMLECSGVIDLLRMSTVLLHNVNPPQPTRIPNSSGGPR